MQTSIEWYSNKLLEILGDKVNEFTQEQTLANHYALKQAKEMHKQEIRTSFVSALRIPNHSDYLWTPQGETTKSEQYYQETFKKD